LLSLDLRIARAFLVTPLALALTLVARFVPAQRAARSVPLDAVRPPVAAVTRRRPVRGIPSLALVNVRRARGRSLLAIAGLLVGVAGLTLLVAINRAFQGSLVGTLLGQAISLQVRGLDFVAVGVTIGLAALSVADVLFTNLRERAAEVVTLRTVGWRDS